MARALCLNLNRTKDREFLQFLALIVNRSIINIQSLAHVADFSANDRRLKEKLLEDLRRLYSAYGIWRTGRRSQDLDLPTLVARAADLGDVMAELLQGTID